MVAPLPLPPLPEGAAIASEAYQSDKAYLERIAEQGRPPKNLHYWHWQMAGIHRIFFDMLERTYAFGPYAEAQDDVLNYLGFAEASFYHMMEHHEAEEDLVFPRIKEFTGLTIWDDNIAEHHDFDDHLAASYVWLRRCREALNPPTQDPIPAPTAAHKAKLDLFPDLAKTRTFDATTLQKHMDSFINKLSTHLVHEVQMLKADNLKTTDQAHMQQLFEELGKYIQRHDPKWYLVALICGTDLATLNSLIELPWFVQYLLVPLVMAPTHRGWWKYAAHPELVTFTGMLGSTLRGEGKFKLAHSTKED